jgi:hypothetical protein
MVVVVVIVVVIGEHRANKIKEESTKLNQQGY